MISKKNRILLLIAFAIIVVSIYFLTYFAVKYDKNSVLGIFTSNTTSPKQNTGVSKNSVLRVIDGDTFVLESGEHIRLIGINAPEISNKECFSLESKNYLANLLQNKTIILVKDKSETDRYGRLLRYVYLDTLFVNNDLVAKGYAKAIKYPPDIKYSDTFSFSQTIAQEENLGLWGKCN